MSLGRSNKEDEVRSGLMMMFLAIMAGCSASPGKGDAEGRAPVADEPITYSAGACFGMCPVFSVTVTPRGGVFHGGAFTARTGDHAFPLTPDQYRRFAETLAPFRPKGERLIADSTADCGQAHTDDSSVNITWGRKDHLALYYGCENPALQRMKDALNKATDLLPIAGFIGRR